MENFADELSLIRWICWIAHHFWIKNIIAVTSVIDSFWKVTALKISVNLLEENVCGDAHIRKTWKSWMFKLTTNKIGKSISLKYFKEKYFPQKLLMNFCKMKVWETYLTDRHSVLRKNPSQQCVHMDFLVAILLCSLLFFKL